MGLRAGSWKFDALILIISYSIYTLDKFTHGPIQLKGGTTLTTGIIYENTSFRHIKMIVNQRVFRL